MSQKAALLQVYDSLGLMVLDNAWKGHRCQGLGFGVRVIGWGGACFRFYFGREKRKEKRKEYQ
jgi:hypothetical protein